MWFSKKDARELSFKGKDSISILKFKKGHIKQKRQTVNKSISHWKYHG